MFLCVVPSPYTEDLFRAIDADGRIKPRVYYMERSQPQHPWRAAELPSYTRVLGGTAIAVGGGRLHFNWGVARALRAEHSDLVVVNSYAGVTPQIAMAWLHLRRRRWVFWGEVPGLHSRGPVGRTLRRLAQGPLRHWAHGVAAVGSRAVAVYEGLTARRCPVANIPYHCDLTHFLAIPRPPAAEASRVRFLYCGQLIARKGVDLLLQSFVRLASEFEATQLTLVGEGPLRRTLEERVPAGLRSRVTFAGYKQIDELPAVFARNDVFVLPSLHDGWGVVVNQAIAAGMPVVASDAVGAACDLVTPNINGLLFSAGDEAGLLRSLRFFAADPGQIQPFGQASRRTAYSWTPECGADRWYRFCAAVLGTAVPDGDGMDRRPN